MSKKLLMVTVLSLVAPGFALADYITPEDLIEISPGVKVRSVSAALVKQLNIADAVVGLYNRDIKDMDSMLTLVRGPNNCIIIIINTENGTKNYVNQVIIKDQECLKSHISH